MDTYVLADAGLMDMITIVTNMKSIATGMNMKKYRFKL